MSRSVNLFKMTAFVLGVSLSLTATAQAGDVKVTEDRETYTLSNGIVTAVVSKRTSDLISMTYKGFETLSHDSGGHSAFYWSHDVSGGKDIVSTVTVDPSKTAGDRAEVSVKGISGGIKMGHGPGTAKDGDLPVDIEIRYSLGRDDTGVYTYCIFDHRPEYASGTMSEARIAAKLVKDFTYIHVDAERSGLYPLLNEGIDKYAYTTLQAEERAFGWTSPEKKMGWFLLNPSAEYLSGGPTKVEFLAHGTHPTVLNYWKSSHYLGANVTVTQGQEWTKVIGPFYLYVNEGATPEAMYADAKARLKSEEAKWPYGWAKSPAYANDDRRATVKGRLKLDDPYLKAYPGTLTVGLTKTPYEIEAPRSDNMPQGQKIKRTLTWQNDAKYYQFWKAQVSPDGTFAVPDVIEGTYTLSAYAEGVLGEFAKAEVSVAAGKPVNLGEIVWTPVRKGKPLWEVGTANRSGKEFAGGKRYFDIGTQMIYAKAFPNDVTYKIGKSKPDKDWFFAQMPHIDGEAAIKPFSGVAGNGRATPYAIEFDVKAAQKGTATLRVAITATNPGGVEVSVNGQPAGVLPLGPPDGALTRHQMYGRYYETELSFDAALLKAGNNRLILTVPAGPLNNGLVYDFLRLEVDELTPFAAPKPG
jgi:rhamnogalacturonan endolyase